MRTGLSNSTTTPTPLTLETGANGTSPFTLVARKGHEKFRLLTCLYISAPSDKPSREKRAPTYSDHPRCTAPALAYFPRTPGAASMVPTGARRPSEMRGADTELVITGEIVV